MFRLCFLALAISASSSAAAGSYSFEAGGSYSEADESNFETESWSGFGRYYFNPVESGTGPLAEAAFLARSSSVGVFYGEFEDEGTIVEPIALNPGVSIGFDPDRLGDFLGLIPGDISFPAFASPILSQPESDTDAYGIDGEYVHRESGWLVGGAYGNTDGDSGFCGNNTENESDHFDIHGGQYITTGTRVVLGYGLEERTTESYLLIPDPPSPGQPFLSPCTATGNRSKTGESDIDQDQDLYLVAFNPSFIDPGVPFGEESLNEWSGRIAGSFYPWRNLGLSLGYVHTDHDAFEFDDYRVGLEWFVLERLALEAAWEHRDNDSGLIDIDSWSVGLRGRF